MTAWIPRLAKGLAALALLVLLLHSASAQDDSRRKQEILLDELPARVVSDAPFQIIAKSTSGLPVALEVVDGPAVMDGKKVRLTGAPGLVIVRATQKGDITFAPAVPAERVFSVRPKPFPPSIEIQPSPASGGVGEQLTLTAAAKGEPMPSSPRLWRQFFAMGMLNNVIPFTLIVFGETQDRARVADQAVGSTAR